MKEDLCSKADFEGFKGYLKFIKFEAINLKANGSHLSFKHKRRVIRCDVYKIILALETER